MDFITKHKGIFLLGGLLALLFVILTALSVRNGGTEIPLTQFITRSRNENTTPVSQPTTPIFSGEPTQPTQPEQPATPPTYPDLLIRYVVGVGWTPSSSNARVGQKIIWRNDSDSDIQLMELLPKSSAIANGVSLAPDQTAEIVLTAAEKGLFTFRELNSGTTARLFVAE